MQFARHREIVNRLSPDPLERQRVNRVVQLFANPRSGGFNSARLCHVVSELKGQGAEVIVTLNLPFLLASPSVTEIEVMGGDGTIRDAVSCMIGADADLLIRIWPSGTVNLLSRELSAQKNGSAITHYAGMIDDQVMLVCASGGPDSRIVSSVSPLLKRWIGRGAYLVSALRQLVFWQEDRFQLEIDGRKISCSAFYLAKGRFYAGPWSFAPQASGSVPMLRGVALTSGGRISYLRFVLEMLQGRVRDRAGLVQFECRNVRIDTDSTVPIQIDGDCTNTGPVALSIREKPLRLHLAGLR